MSKSFYCSLQLEDVVIFPIKEVWGLWALNKVGFFAWELFMVRF